jgi:hypothetical protein
MSENESIAYWACLILANLWAATADSGVDFVISAAWMLMALCIAIVALREPESSK